MGLLKKAAAVVKGKLPENTASFDPPDAFELSVEDFEPVYDELEEEIDEAGE